jgi:hypothetical protein
MPFVVNFLINSTQLTINVGLKNNIKKWLNETDKQPDFYKLDAQ